MLRNNQHKIMQRKIYKEKVHKIRTKQDRTPQPRQVVILGDAPISKLIKKEPLFNDGILWKWMEQNVSYLEELNSYEQEQIFEALQKCIEEENKIFVFEIYLGRSPHTDMRTYEFIGATTYLTDDEYDKSRYTVWQYSQEVFYRNELIKELNNISAETKEN